MARPFFTGPDRGGDHDHLGDHRRPHPRGDLGVRPGRLEALDRRRRKLQEALIAESLVPVTFEIDRECRVGSGKWYGAFTGAYFEDPGDVDVDHMVPLKNAHNSGGWA